MASFIAGLSQADLDRLRTVVKAIHFRHYPKEFVTDREADKLIEAVGPETAGLMLRRAVDRKMNMAGLKEDMGIANEKVGR